MIKIKLKSLYVLNRPIAGTIFSPELQQRVNLLVKYLTNLYVYGVKPETSGGITTALLTKDAELEFDLDHFNLAMSFPATKIEGFKPFIKIAEGNINKQVPVELENSTYPEEFEIKEGDIVIHEAKPSKLKTWNEYFLNYSRNGVQGNYTPELKYNGYYYYKVIGSKKGEALTGKELLLISADTAVELIMTLPKTL